MCCQVQGRGDKKIEGISRLELAARMWRSGVGDGVWPTRPHVARSRASTHTCMLLHSLCRVCLGQRETGTILDNARNCGARTCLLRRRLHTHSTRRNRPYPGFVLISNKGASRTRREWLHVSAKSWTIGDVCLSPMLAELVACVGLMRGAGRL